MKYLLKKIAQVLIILFCLFYTLSSPAYALNFTNISPGTINGLGVGTMNSILNDLGVDQNELRYNVQTMNASRRKMIQPQVSIGFTPLNPAPGEKVTAEATPSYFLNNIEDLYFTWYLKSAICNITQNPNSEQIRKCDLDNSGQVTINDYKIKAMRIIANYDFEWEKASYAQDSDDDGYQAIMGGNDQGGKNNYCYVHNVTTGDEYNIGCDHLFPSAPRYTTGDGSFGAGEESFWHTDPNNEDTADTGNKDEANVAGLGINGFTWTYEQGDEVGVVVEGVSTNPAQTTDASYRTMWALSQNKCDATAISSASDINNCLYDNLVDPAQGGGATERLKVELTYSPKSPINDPDPASNSGDLLVVHSSILNAQDKNYLKYTWQVYQSDEANPESWGTPLLKSALPESSQTVGLGLDTFKFKLNFPSPRKYFKIKLTVTENIGGGVVREGHSDVVVSINSTSSRIRAYEAAVSDSLSVSLGSNEICQEGTERAVCPVSKNEIVGVTIPASGLSDFFWTIDGAPFVYETCFFEGCNSASQTNLAFFPVLKNKGERYTVTLTATNQTTGQKIELTKVFEVADPKVKITCADSSCQPVLLGNYIDLDGKQWPDLSQINFWSTVGSSPKLSAATTGFSASANSFSWFVDGLAITSANAGTYGYSLGSDGTITLAPKLLGESYDVTVNAPYTQSDSVKKALNQYWGVTYDQFYEAVISDNVNVEMMNSTAPIAAAPSQKILANIYSSVPSYLAFLLRIVLTAFIILIGSVFILSLFPKTRNEL